MSTQHTPGAVLAHRVCANCSRDVFYVAGQSPATCPHCECSMGTTTEWLPGQRLHIYGQHCWHDEAYLVGSRIGLTALRDAIDAALSAPTGRCAMNVFANDGEGYRVGVVAVSDETFDKLAAPYSGDIAREPNPSGSVWPHELEADGTEAAP